MKNLHDFDFDLSDQDIEWLQNRIAINPTLRLLRDMIVKALDPEIKNDENDDQKTG